MCKVSIVNNNISDRIVFLAEKFDIFEATSEVEDAVEGKLVALAEDGYLTERILSGKDTIAIVSKKQKPETKYFHSKVSVSSEIFASMIAADPTENKAYLQWMLTTFTRYLKNGGDSIEMAKRFACEDLPQANVYLTLFEDNKRKRKFKELCQASFSTKNITDPTNINQYKSLSQLFDAVDPFIEREPSAVERTMNKFVDSGQAVIPVRDRKYTVFIPKTTEANVIFGKFANWCTARDGNGMFKSYTTSDKKPNGQNSDIYIVIDNNFFKGESDRLYQLHFETSQLKDRSNSSNIDFYEEVLKDSEALTDYFKEELLGMAKSLNSVDNNKYLDFLLKFGFTESLFDLYPEETPTIKIMKHEIKKLPDLSRFKNVDQFVITNAKLTELHPSVCAMSKIELLSIPGNKLTSLPKEIADLKKLLLLNITGNPIKNIPTEITLLDRSNGGLLERVIFREGDVKIIKRLQELLPTAVIN